jgi:uncharacterized protein YdeI (YjbR/CyaY-like superfamily)
MRPSGLAQVEAAKADGRWQKAYRIAGNEAPPDLMEAIRAEPKALAMYEKLTSQNRFALTFRTNSMKTEAGRKKKIEGFVAMLKKGETIHPNGAGATPKVESGNSPAEAPTSKPAKSSKATTRKLR